MKLGNAKVFLYNGAGMEPWVPQFLQGVGNAGLVAVDTSKGIDFITSKDPGEPGTDPHVWLDPLLAKKQVAAIRDAFVEADPAGRDYYEKNAADYMAKLDALDAEFRTAMASCRKRDILIAHATLGYFCREYGCNQIPIEGMNPEAEPLPRDIVNIVNQAREHNATTVFVEKLVSPKAAQTIAEEINGTTVTFNSVHGITLDEMNRNETYLSLMHENVQIIKTALECS
jgi:zinc transport system substrate-binding protein